MAFVKRTRAESYEPVQKDEPEATQKEIKEPEPKAPASPAK